MKKTILSLLFITLLSSLILAQSPGIASIKSFSLKNYQSPDIKFRRLMLGASFINNGSYLSENSNTVFTFQLNSDLNYYQYSFTEKYQGISLSSFLLDLRSQPQKDSDNSSVSNNVSTYLDYYTQSRFYYSNDVFLGVYAGSYYQFRRSAQKSDDETQGLNSNNISINPYFSVGKGRVQPVRSARTAMDIFISLDKYGRLKHTPSNNEINTLAEVANEIVYKRFYDFRYKIVYQLEELDKALQSMNIIDTADIVYFANLSDIWEYGNWQRRASGSRFEGGFAPSFNALYQNSELTIVNGEGSDKYLDYGIYGFLSFNHFNPTSYAWQSDFFVDLSFGVNWTELDEYYSSDIDYQNSYSTSQTLNGLLNVMWEFSYYPNTRTRLALTPFTSVSYQKPEEGDSDYGVNTGIYFSTYYYVSPRFRISAYARIKYYHDFSTAASAPFWNTYLYNKPTEYSSLNDVVTRQYNLSSLQDSFLGYHLNFSISYAIF